MIKIFAGEDSFTSYNAALEFATQLSQETKRQLTVLNADELAGIGELLTHLQSVSLFGAGEVVLAKRLLHDTTLAKYIHANADNLSSSYLIIWHDQKLDKRLGLVKDLIAAKSVTEFNLPVKGELTSWLMAQAKSKGLKLSSANIGYIIKQLGNDTGRINSELEKLALFVNENERELTPRLLAEVIGTEVTGDIWKLLDNLGRSNKAPAAQELEKLLTAGDSGQYVISMLARELQIISSVMYIQKTGGKLSDLGLHKFVLEKAVQKSRLYSWTKLQKLFRALFKLDLAVKQGRMDEKVGLLLLVLSW